MALITKRKKQDVPPEIWSGGTFYDEEKKKMKTICNEPAFCAVLYREGGAGRLQSKSGCGILRLRIP
jgi:hypothetical protein